MNLQVGVKALIKNGKNEYLFLRRSAKLSTDSNEVSWDIPGGRINPDEALLDALSREIEEETGYKITSIPLLLYSQDIFVDAKNLHVVRLTYVINEEVPSINLSDEHIEYKWVKGTDINNVEAEPYLAEILHSIQ